MIIGADLIAQDNFLLDHLSWFRLTLCLIRNDSIAKETHYYQSEYRRIEHIRLYDHPEMYDAEDRREITEFVQTRPTLSPQAFYPAVGRGDRKRYKRREREHSNGDERSLPYIADYCGEI